MRWPVIAPTSRSALRAKDRRAAAHIPEDVAFRTKPQIAAELVRDLAVLGQVGLDWVVADSEYGRAGHLLDELELLGQRYVLEVPVICNGMSEKTPHATQKPEALIERLILASSTKDQLVVDPFVGSGTTAVVAQKLGRRWLAGDADARYVGLTRDRLTRS